MSGSGGKGGGSTSEVKIPAWLEQGMQRNLARAEKAAQIGKIVNYGPAVAALDPMQKLAMQGSYDAASAFGLAPRGGDALAGIPEEQQFAGGVMGYSSAPLFEAARAEFEAKNPQQAAAFNSMFVPYGTPETNPTTPSDMTRPGFIPPYGSPEFDQWIASITQNIR